MIRGQGGATAVPKLFLFCPTKWADEVMKTQCFLSLRGRLFQNKSFNMRETYLTTETSLIFTATADKMWPRVKDKHTLKVRLSPLKTNFDNFHT